MLEAELRDLLSVQLEAIEPGLILVKKEQYIPNDLGTRSFIDLLARDREDRWVLIELKRSGAASREAIHEIYKYIEGVKAHLRVRDDEVRAIIASTDWKELLVPYSRFFHDTDINVKGFQIEVGPNSQLSTNEVSPMPIVSGRLLSPWHEISLYRSEERLKEGIAGYDASCEEKGVEDYLLVIMKAPEGFYERSVEITANAISGIRRGSPKASEGEIAEMFEKMERLDWMIYFVPQLLSAEAYLKIIAKTPETLEEVNEFLPTLGEEEALCSLQEYASSAPPAVTRDYFEIGYAAKFKSKLIETEGWTITEILRRGAFERNSALTDETILGEISGDAGTSGQRFNRSFKLNDRAAFSTALNDIKECLVNNQAWAAQISSQLEEALRDFPDAFAKVSIYSPSTGVFTIFFTTTRDDGVLYVPTYSIEIHDSRGPRRLYAGEITEAKDLDVGPMTFLEVLRKHYEGDIGGLVMLMSSGGYESRDAEILDDLNLDYTSFRVDVDGNERQFFRATNNRWRSVEPIEMFGAYRAYLERNAELVRIVIGKLEPRVGPVMCDSSSADRQLEDVVVPDLARSGQYRVHLPGACDLCGSPLAAEPYISRAKVKGRPDWANMCADCTVYRADDIAGGAGRLYRREGDGRWLLVAGPVADEE
jgi:hypothetical protein